MAACSAQSAKKKKILNSNVSYLSTDLTVSTFRTILFSDTAKKELCIYAWMRGQITKLTIVTAEEGTINVYNPPSSMKQMEVAIKCTSERKQLLRETVLLKLQARKPKQSFHIHRPSWQKLTIEREGWNGSHHVKTFPLCMLSIKTVIQQVRSADLLCNSPAGVIKGAATKTLRGDRGGQWPAVTQRDHNDHGKSQHRLSLFLSSLNSASC